MGACCEDAPEATGQTEAGAVDAGVADDEVRAEMRALLGTGILRSAGARRSLWGSTADSELETDPMGLLRWMSSADEVEVWEE